MVAVLPAGQVTVPVSGSMVKRSLVNLPVGGDRCLDFDLRVDVGLLQLLQHFACAVGRVAVDGGPACVITAGCRARAGVQDVMQQLCGELPVADAGGADRGRGDDFGVGVDGDVAFVAVEPAVAGLVPVPGGRVHGGDGPVRGDLAGDPEDPVGVFLQVLTQHCGQQLRGLTEQLGQLTSVECGQHAVAVTSPRIDKCLTGRGVVPVDAWFGATGVVVTAGDDRAQLTGQCRPGHGQQTSYR